MPRNLRYWLKNLPHRARGWKQEAYAIAGINVQSALSLKLFRNCERDEHGHTLLDAFGMPLAFNRVDDLGLVGRRVITTAGVNFLATAFTNTAEAENINWHEYGTGTTAEAVGQTALITPSGVARVAGTQSTPGSTNIYRSVATTSFTSSLAITEHGIFSAVTSGTLFDRTLFSAINVVNGDSIQATYDLTLPSGG